MMRVDNLDKVIQFVLEHENDDIRQLALSSEKYIDLDIKFALQQISGRKTAKHKIPYWHQNNHILYPSHLSMEQCSSEKTARYKANLCQGKTFVDLTGGFGVDIAFMSLNKNIIKATYVEIQEDLVRVALHNFSALNLNKIKVEHTESVSFLENIKEKVDTIYIDPARRDNKSGQKVMQIEDCMPDLTSIDDLLNKKSGRTIIKLSPMLDISRAVYTISNITEIHILSVANDCKELLLIKEPSKHKEDIKIHCVNLLNDDTLQTFCYSAKEEILSNVEYTANTGTYLYEPNSSILKAGAYKLIASHYHLQKLHPNSHLYTSDEYIENFPGRKFLIEQILSVNKKEIKAYLHNLNKANISIRNYPSSVEKIRTQIKLKEGGNKYIFATTLANEKKVLILCEKAQSPISQKN